MCECVCLCVLRCNPYVEALIHDVTSFTAWFWKLSCKDVSNYKKLGDAITKQNRGFRRARTHTHTHTHTQTGLITPMLACFAGEDGQHSCAEAVDTVALSSSLSEQQREYKDLIQRYRERKSPGLAASISGEHWEGQVQRTSTIDSAASSLPVPSPFALFCP